MGASAFGLREEKADKATVFRMLEGFLLDVHRRNVRAILIIDEAQGIPVSALDELRMLSNVYPTGRPLLKIFLLGQPAFRPTHAAPGLQQFPQRRGPLSPTTPHRRTDTGASIQFPPKTARR